MSVEKKQQSIPLTSLSPKSSEALPESQPEPTSSSPKFTSQETHSFEAKEDIALTSYPPTLSSDRHSNLLRRFKACCDTFKELNLFNEGAQFTLQEKNILEVALDKIAKLLNEYGVFPEYDAHAACSADNLLSVINKNELWFRTKEIDTYRTRLTELATLMKGQDSIPSTLASLKKDAERLSASIKEYSEAKEIKTADSAQQIIRSYSFLLSECRFNGCLTNDIFLYTDLANTKQRQIIHAELIQAISYLQTTALTKYTEQLEEALQYIAEALDAFDSFIKAHPPSGSIDSLFGVFNIDSSTTRRGPKFPELQAVLKSHYSRPLELWLPLSGQQVPIEVITSPLISDEKIQESKKKIRRHRS